MTLDHAGRFRLRDKAAPLHLGLGLACVVLYTFGPDAAQTVATAYVAIAGLVAMHVGPRWYTEASRRAPWRFLLVGSYLFVTASVIRQLVPSTMSTPPTNAALLTDVLVVPAYLCMGLMLNGMLRRRRAADDDPARLDALLVGLAGAFMAWVFLISPTVVQDGITPFRIADSFFPVIDVVLLTLVAQLAFAGGARQPAMWVLVFAIAIMFVADLLFTLRDGLQATVAQHTLDTMFLIMFLLLSVTALLPSMRTLTEPQRIVVRDLSRVRLLVIATMMAVPVAVTSLVHSTTIAVDVIRTVLCELLIFAVLTRVVRSNNSRARAESANRHRATHDALTDLPNRELLTETVTSWSAKAIADDHEISLVFLDLDHFKIVNDHWGHQVGDELLCAVAERLRSIVRSEDLVARIGGDEYVIAMAGPSHDRLAENLAERLLGELTKPYELSVGEVVISASMGVARSEDGAHALELIRDADTAMYKAKGSGRNAYALFDHTLRDRLNDRVRIESALRGAIERGELAVHFQPIVDFTGDELDGFEALMRWNSPELGNVPPINFIPVAEDTGMIVEMGNWLLRAAARQLAVWTAEAGPDARQLHVSVNVAVRQLSDDSLVPLVREVLRETGLPASALWLEITESGVMEDLDTALRTLNALRAIGVTLCIDDFGTGYSSLSYLHRLPVGILKVDRSFTRDVGEAGPNEPIVRAVLAMTKAMGLRVVAEGVETETQRDWLRAQGCELAQGWFYGKADLPENLTGWIQRRVPA